VPLPVPDSVSVVLSLCGTLPADVDGAVVAVAGVEPEAATAGMANGGVTGAGAAFVALGPAELIAAADAAAASVSAASDDDDWEGDDDDEADGGVAAAAFA